MKLVLLFLLWCFPLMGCAQMPTAPTSELPKAETATPTPAVTPGVTPAAPTAAPTPAPAVPKKEGLAFGGHLMLAFQNWSRVGESSQQVESKMGVGLGGTLGVGYQFDNMKFIVGPQLWVNRWSQTYTRSNPSATATMYIEMADAGFALATYFDDFFLEIGTGSSTFSAGTKLNGVETLSVYSKTSYPYNSVLLGMKSDYLLFGLGMKNYGDYAKYASHYNFFIGAGF